MINVLALGVSTMRISQKGLYALQAMTHLARRHSGAPLKIKDIASQEGLPEKFLKLILLEMNRSRLVESVRGARGGYRLRRLPSEIYLGEIIRIIDGPLAPFGDAESLRRLVRSDTRHGALFEILLDVRNAAAKILDGTSLADISGAAPAAIGAGR
jgi:Rrf2 family protein